MRSAHPVSKLLHRGNSCDSVLPACRRGGRCRSGRRTSCRFSVCNASRYASRLSGIPKHNKYRDHSNRQVHRVTVNARVSGSSNRRPILHHQRRADRRRVSPCSPLRKAAGFLPSAFPSISRKVVYLQVGHSGSRQTQSIDGHPRMMAEGRALTDPSLRSSTCHGRTSVRSRPVCAADVLSHTRAAVLLGFVSLALHLMDRRSGPTAIAT